MAKLYKMNLKASSLSLKNNSYRVLLANFQYNPSPINFIGLNSLLELKENIFEGPFKMSLNFEQFSRLKTFSK